MKKYNLFCLKENSAAPGCLEVTEQINVSSLTRRGIFDFIFQYCLPQIDYVFMPCSYETSVSISRSFFSPFNMTTKFRRYAFHLDYLKKAYNYLFDKIVLARVCVESCGINYIYVFFAKEVSNE